MFRQTILSLLLAAAFAALAADTPAADQAAADPPARAHRPLDLAQAIELVAKDYPGRAIAAQIDPAGGRSVHYHIDVLFSTGKMARLDVDARTSRVVSRMPPSDEDGVSVLPLVDAVRTVEAKSRGRVEFAEFDLDPAPHYHMNVRLRTGKIMHYDLDLETGKVSRHPPH